MSEDQYQGVTVKTTQDKRLVGLDIISDKTRELWRPRSCWMNQAVLVSRPKNSRRLQHQLWCGFAVMHWFWST